MRADRLLAMLMILQNRGRMRACDLAAELEVSERTVYRDILALSSAGVPVYAERGPGGGVSLVESYRTNLTGLNLDEVRALFMLNIPAPLAELGVGEELRAAMLKLAAALPDSRRQEERSARQRFFLDSVPWQKTEEPLPYLHSLKEAVWQNRVIDMTYRSMVGAPVERRVEPYGLVAKTNIWYLIAAGGEIFRVYRVAHIVKVNLQPRTFDRKEDFDLAVFWRQYCAGIEASRSSFRVRLRISPDLLPILDEVFGESTSNRLGEAPQPDPNGWVQTTLSFDTFEAARERVLSLGRAVEVLEPLALRLSVKDYAEQTLRMYTKEAQL